MSTLPTIPVIEDSVKLRFAAAMLRTKNASTAALEVIQDAGAALRQAYILPHDPLVIEEMGRLTTENGEASFLPTKFAIARDILDRAKACLDPDGFEKLMKLYCNVMGYIEKPGANVSVAVAVSNVLVVTDHGTDEEWAAKSAAQQKGLVLNAAN